MSETFFNYQVFCIDEGTYVNDGSYRTTPPTSCPNNPSHQINPNATVAIGSIQKNEVVIQESTSPNGGNFMSSTVHITAPANTVTVNEDLKYPFPIVALISYVNSSAIHTGDKVSLFIKPKRPIGVLGNAITPPTNWVSQNYLVGDRVIYNGLCFTCIANTDANQAPLGAFDEIQHSWWNYGYRLPISTTPAAMAYICVGYYINVTDGVNNDNLNRVLSIDTTNHYLYLENGPTNSYAAGSFIQLKIYSIKDYELGEPGRTVIGAGKIGGKGIPARTPICVEYQNLSGPDKTFIAGFEFLF